MKKSLVITLALVFVLGLAGTAFANPYSDVPAGHWAYKAVVDLQKAGVMEGAGGKFMGNQTLTRYEIAAITARAMAKADKADAATKATIDKLAVEFSKELNDLGVRVAKLEKNQNTFKWSGDYRMRWVDQDAANGGSDTQHRLRLAANAQVNENISVYMRIMAFDHTDLGRYADTQGNDMDIRDINATIKNFAGFSDLTVGRFSHKLGTIGYYLDSTGRFDGAKMVVPMGDLKLTAAFADADIEYKQSTGATPAIPDDPSTTEEDENEYQPAKEAKKTSTEVTTAQLDWAATKDLTLSAYYLSHAGKAITGFGKDIVGFGAKYAFDNDWNLAADFMTVDKGNIHTGKAGKDADNLHVRVSYKAAKASEVGSWGAWVEYADFESAALDTGASINAVDGKEFFGLGASTTLAKNVVFNAFYYDFDKVKGEKPKSGKSYTRAEVNFLF